jgi:hypothetical protein
MSLSGCRSGSAQQTENSSALYYSPDTAVISGSMRQSTYLSVMDGSGTEYINVTIILFLEKSVTIASNPKTMGKPSPALNGIDHIEIENDFDFAVL